MRASHSITCDVCEQVLSSWVENFHLRSAGTPLESNHEDALALLKIFAEDPLNGWPVLHRSTPECWLLSAREENEVFATTEKFHFFTSKSKSSSFQKFPKFHQNSENPWIREKHCFSGKVPKPVNSPGGDPPPDRGAQSSVLTRHFCYCLDTRFGPFSGGLKVHVFGRFSDFHEISKISRKFANSAKNAPNRNMLQCAYFPPIEHPPTRRPCQLRTYLVSSDARVIDLEKLFLPDEKIILVSCRTLTTFML